MSSGISSNQDRPPTGTNAATGIESTGNAPLGRAPAASNGPTIIGESAPLLAVMQSASRVADSNVTVLIQGERGTGKELLARFLHERSPRRDAPFMTINCSAIPEHLLEIELFGHAQGRAGRLEQASRGTLFLDEISDMPLPLQARLLRVIQELRVERIGGRAAIPVDARLIAASTRTLEDEVAAGRFREDLYYQLAVVVLTLPPLRERGDDIRMLAEQCVTKAAREHRRPVFAISQETLLLLKSHRWPGNVRQLVNVMEHALLMADGPVLLPAHLPPEIRFSSSPSTVHRGLDPAELGAGRNGERLLSLAELERRHIRRALSLTGGHLAQAAESLGIHRNTLRRKLQEYGIERGGAAGGRTGDINTPAAAPPHPPAPENVAARERLSGRLAQGA